EEIEHRAEGVLHEVHYSAEMRPYRGAQKAEGKLEKANLDYLQKKAQAEHPTSNPISRWRQKQEIKRQYAAAKAGKATTHNTAEAVSSGVSSAVETVKEIGKKLFSNKKLWTAVLGIFFLLSFLLNVMSSCSVIIEGVGSVLAGSTYPASDNALLGAEAMYKGKEDDLRQYLNSYESSHDYDEYHFDLDEITHDPYVLSSLLSALDPNSLSLGAVAELIDRIFDQQYILTENVVTETRYKTETKTRNEYTYNAESGSYEWHSYTYTEQVPYDYTICTVTLENRDLSHLPVEILTSSQLNMYATYMATLGNRPDLFPGSPYVELYLNKTDQSFDFPPDALSDDRVAAMLKEAQKYLGYPYVWGGSSPSTSFDCSGYVCWVVNHSGWNIGRLSAQGICNICTPISASNLKPGDLVFFKGTYDTPGVSHCGIYVGNGTMIHCGDPIKYANINTTYWQSHFYMFGRLP
ncbi:MAG: NlpC/P60 family protein, partial [Lachnospiraceae bacterium]|nr:NlpC/P60 family protein [Lachnospiraceae bacterium]